MPDIIEKFQNQKPPHDNLPPAMEARLRGTVIIWVVLTLFALFLPLFTSTTNDAGISAAIDSRLVVIVFGVMAATMAITTVVLRFYVLSKAQLTKFRETRLRGLERKAALQKLFKHWIVIEIAAWTLNDSIANLGLMMSKFSASSKPALVLSLLALGLNILTYPNFKATVGAAGLSSDRSFE